MKNNFLKLYRLIAYILCIMIAVGFIIIMAHRKDLLYKNAVKNFDTIAATYNFSKAKYGFDSERFSYEKNDTDFNDKFDCSIEYSFSNYKITSCNFHFEKYDENIYSLIEKLFSDINIDVYDRDIKNVVENKLYDNGKGFINLNNNQNVYIAIYKNNNGKSDYYIYISI